MMIRPERIHTLHEGTHGDGPVVYLMNREVRMQDNWALLHAQHLAHTNKRPLIVVYNFVPGFLGSGQRQHLFTIAGLREVEEELRGKSIPLYLFYGKHAIEDVASFAVHHDAHTLVTDFSPLREHQAWMSCIKTTNITLLEVDAHNIVPCRFVSSKLEYAASTFRPKIHKLLPLFLEEFPNVVTQKFAWHHSVPSIHWRTYLHDDTVNPKPFALETPQGGAHEANDTLHHFINTSLRRYAEGRHNPLLHSGPGLSPFLHAGHICAARVALTLKKSTRGKNVDAFLEDLIIKSQLADNACLFNEHYTSSKGFPDWAQKTLLERVHHKRAHLYSLAQFETSHTHDALFNAANNELVVTGGMHEFMRNYWAKKILEWTRHPDEAMRSALTLYNRYALDGCGPRGYAGIAHAIGGLHDRPRKKLRPIFGAVSTINRTGCTFDVDAYIAEINHLVASVGEI